MAPSLDCAVSSLLCAEETDSIYYDDDDVEFGVEDFEATWHHRKINQKQSFNGEESMSGLPLQSDNCLTLMLKNEFDHLPGNDYLGRLRNGDLDLGARQEAVDWIGKVHAHFSFGPLCAYLSVNYLDRFLSAYDLPGKSWMMQLLAVACLSLAAKMEETEVPLCVDLQVCESKIVFGSRTIQRMELLVLSTLKWRMQAITPFSFIDYFLAKLNKNGIDFLEFKPSEIAAAVAMSVVGETQIVNNEKALYELIHHLYKEKVVKSVELMNKLSSLSGTTPKGLSGSVPFSVPQSPIGLLEAACFSYRTDVSTIGTCANSSH